MTYGLFNEIMAVVPSPEEIGELLITNQGLRDYIIRRVLTGSKKVMTEEDLIDPFEMDIDMDEISGMVNWVGDHVLYFFMTNASKTKALAEKYQETILQLAQSKSGAAN
jgi:hypothetical protein